MPRRKKHAAEEIVAKLRQVEVLTGQGTPVADAIRAIGVTENIRLRKAVADLTLEKLILKEAASGNW